jgi:endonuclease YncB( thermonuclease family)
MKNLLWALIGAATLLAILVLVFHFQPRGGSAELAAYAKRKELTEQMRFALASAAEAEKSAVLAITDRDSQTFADQARAATAEVERRRVELSALSSTDQEKELLAQFSTAFVDLQRVDKELLELAVKNTNLKGAALAFGPAAEAIREMDAALAKLIAEEASSSAGNARKAMALAAGAQAGALRIHSLLPQHIAEESDAKMDALEAQMTQQDQEVRRDLKELGAFLPSAHEVETATSQYARFAAVKTQILKLSRENTNVRSLSISLHEKRKVTALCQDALSALEKAIEDERPVRGEPPAKPR